MLKVGEGNRLMINCSAMGHPLPAYSWDRGDRNEPIMYNNKWLSWFKLLFKLTFIILRRNRFNCVVIS